ncbi:MAG TPA: AtpZ/AtpI family protein, partial [Magnetovibrio sp.]
ISGLVVGVGLGWLMDDWFDTKPFLMIVFIFLGGAAGMLNVYRTSMQMAEDAKNGAKTEPTTASEQDSGADGREK